MLLPGAHHCSTLVSIEKLHVSYAAIVPSAVHLHNGSQGEFYRSAPIR